jgi:alanine-glyoxylate transaminase / serine-glyoxylate transaminase / serine-pyruvate transaminase
MLHEEGLDNVFARHKRHAQATRLAVRAWGLDVWCAKESDHSPSLTTVLLPDGHSADRLRAIALERFDLSLGAGLSQLADKVFRIGHLGDVNDLTILAALAGVEMALGPADIPHRAGGVAAAMSYLAPARASLSGLPAAAPELATA